MLYRELPCAVHSTRFERTKVKTDLEERIGCSLQEIVHNTSSSYSFGKNSNQGALEISDKQGQALKIMNIQPSSILGLLQPTVLWKKHWRLVIIKIGW